MMDLDRLRLFHAVAEAGSLTGAGAALGLSQSAVSRQISALEEELQVMLFQRHARGLVLTEQGELLHGATIQMFKTFEAARDALLESRERAKGDLRVTATVGITTHWLMPHLKSFMDAYPDIRLHILIADHELDLAMREADVAIRMRAPIQSELIQRRLFAVRYNVYAAKDYLAIHGAPETPADLDRHALIVYGETAPPELRDLNWLLDAGRKGPPREPTLRVNNIHALAMAIENGIGIGLLPSYYVRENSRMSRVLADCATPIYDIHLAYPETLRHSKRVAAFRDFLYRHARDWDTPARAA